MNLNPKIVKVNGVWWLTWNGDAEAIAYDIDLGTTHVQAGRKATSAKLGVMPPKVMPKIAAAHAGVYETATDPSLPPPPPPSSGLPRFGVATGYKILTRNQAVQGFELDQIKQVGAGVVRFDSTPGNQYQVDAVVAKCSVLGLKVILVLWGTTGPGADPKFAGDQALKWAGNPTVVAFEFCNEPDLHGWTPYSYADLVHAGGAKVRLIDPGRKIAAGALWKGSGTAPLLFTDALIRVAPDLFDYVSLHLYDDPNERGGWNIWDMAYPFAGGFYNGRTVREKLDAAGLAHIPIISTESGGPTPKYSPAKQAQIVRNALAEAAKGKIACCCVYSMMDDDVVGYGMLDQNRQKRPSWDAYKAAAS